MGPRVNSRTVCICHATASAQTPYVRTCVNERALQAHRNHQNQEDIIPAPAEGCPGGNNDSDLTVDCAAFGSNMLLTNFAIRRASGDDFRYDFGCAPAASNLTCADIEASVQDDKIAGDGTQNLNRQSAACPADSALQQFVLKQPRHNLSYYGIRCCKPGGLLDDFVACPDTDSDGTPDYLDTDRSASHSQKIPQISPHRFV